MFNSCLSVSFVVGLSVKLSVLSVEVTVGHRYILMRMWWAKNTFIAFYFVCTSLSVQKGATVVCDAGMRQVNPLSGSGSFCENFLRVTCSIRQSEIFLSPCLTCCRVSFLLVFILCHLDSQPAFLDPVFCLTLRHFSFAEVSSQLVCS